MNKSCAKCLYAKLPRIADISLGDYWNITDIHPEMDDDKGTSLVIVNTNKGLDAFKQLKLTSCQTDLKKASQWNGGLMDKISYNRRRKHFFAKVKGAKKVIKQIQIHMLPERQYQDLITPIWKKYARKLKNGLLKKK